MTAMIINSLFPVNWVVCSAVLVLCLLGWLEIKRKQKLLAVRLVALLLAIFSLVCLILNPSLKTKKTSDTILLTHNYNKEILDSLLNANSKSQLYKLKGVPGPVKAVEIQNYRDLSDLHGNIFLLGEGLPQYMLEYVDTSSLQYFPSPTPEGFIGINSNKTYIANQRGEIKGIVMFSREHTVTLTGPGAAEDSIHVNAGTSQAFSVSFMPKAAGLYLYTLTASDSSGKVRYTEQVPVQVKEQKILSILFLSDYPTAEIRFLKNFLEKKNHKLTLRYKISRDKYRTEFVNTPQKSIGRLNETLLQNFDLVITDASSLTSFTGAEIHSLKEAIKDGLGTVTLINTASLSKQANDFLSVTLTKVKSDSAHLEITKQRLKIPATPVSIASERNLFSIQRESSGRMVSGYYQSGLGKSGFQLLSNTFSFELAGEKELYAELWSPLIEAIARREINTYDVSFTTPFPYYSDEPVEFKIVAGAEKPTVRIDSLEIPLIEDPLIKNVWYGKIWAGQVGWNQLRIDQDSSQHNLFVSQPEGWRSLQVLNQQKNMRKLSSQKEGVAEQVLYQSVSRILFFALFLLSAGFLWLAPKL
jgi:hypothetical protein